MQVNTNENTLIAKIVGLVIALVVLGMVLVPFVTDATTTERTFKNEGYYNLDKTAEDFTFSWDYTSPTEFVINNETVTYTNTNAMDVSIVLGEKFAVRLQPQNAKVTFYGLGTYITADSINTTLTVTVESGTLTATNENTSKSVTDVTELYYISETGPYVMKKSDSIAYLNSGSEIVADSEIYASGQTFNGAKSIFWHLEGTIDDMDYPDAFDNLLQISDETINGQYSNRYNDLFELSNITFTAYNTYQELSYNVTASYFVVPAEVTAELSQHASNIEITLYQMIPILVVLGLIVAIVGMFAYNRYGN